MCSKLRIHETTYIHENQLPQILKQYEYPDPRDCGGLPKHCSILSMSFATSNDAQFYTISLISLRSLRVCSKYGTRCGDELQMQRPAKVESITFLSIHPHLASTSPVFPSNGRYSGHTHRQHNKKEIFCTSIARRTDVRGSPSWASELLRELVRVLVPFGRENRHHSEQGCPAFKVP